MSRLDHTPNDEKDCTARERLVILFQQIDTACTGFDPKPTASSWRHYRETAEKICEVWEFSGDLYLSDGGYSRILIDTHPIDKETPVLRPSWVSTDRCIEAWEKHGEKFIEQFEKIRKDHGEIPTWE